MINNLLLLLEFPAADDLSLLLTYSAFDDLSLSRIPTSCSRSPPTRTKGKFGIHLTC